MNISVAELVLPFCRKVWVVCAEVCKNWRRIIISYLNDPLYLRNPMINYQNSAKICNQYAATTINIKLIEWLFHAGLLYSDVYYTEKSVNPSVGKAVFEYVKYSKPTETPTILKAINMVTFQPHITDWDGFDHPQNLAILFRQICPARNTDISIFFTLGYTDDFIEQWMALTHISNSFKYKKSPDKWKRWLDDNNYTSYTKNRKYPGDPKIIYEVPKKKPCLRY